jgi:molybdopterin converting factor subunit 1
MRVTVKLFAILRDRAGVSESSIDLADESTVTVAAEALATKFPPIANFLGRCAFAVNQDYVDRSAVLRDGDELAVIPPVSGG